MIYNLFIRGIILAGSIFSVKIFTESMEPDLFAEYKLYFGLTLLFTSAFFKPLWQFAMRVNLLGGDYWLTVKKMKTRLFCFYFLASIILTLLFGYLGILLILLLCALLAFDCINSYFISAGMQKSINISLLFNQLLIPLFIVLNFIVFKHYQSNVNILIAFAIVAYGLGFCFLIKVTNFKRNQYVPIKNDIISLNRYTFPLHFNSLFNWVNGQSSRYILLIFITTSQIGKYIALYSIISMAYLNLSNFLNQYFYSKLTNLKKEIDWKKFSQYLVIYVLFSLLGGCLILFDDFYLLSFFIAEQYLNLDFNIIYFLILSCFLVGLNYVLESIFYIKGHTLYISIANVTGGIVGVVSCFLLSDVFGLLGASISFLISTSVILILLLVSFVHINKKYSW